MTKKLFDTDSYIRKFTATVTECHQTTYNKQQVFSFMLDQTAFFPEEGGQECDNGTISYLIPGTDEYHTERILHVSVEQNGTEQLIHHICEKELPVGLMIEGKIDFEERYDKMQQHSGEHLVSGYVFKTFGYDNVGFHLGKEDVTLDFNGTFTDEQILDIEENVNRFIYKNVKSVISFPSEEELKVLPYRSKKELKGQIRIVEFPGMDICACCAPHVAFTGEIGIVKIISAEHFRGGTRITIKCGQRALKYFDKCIDDRRHISQLLSVKPDNTTEAVDKLNERLNTVRYESNALQRKYFELLTHDPEIIKNHYFFTEFGEPDILRESINLLTGENEGYYAVFFGNDEKGYRFIIGSPVLDCRAFLNSINKQLSIKGGGAKDMVQGTCMSSKEEIINIISERIKNNE